MNKTYNSTNQWFIQIEDKQPYQRISVYENGLVYGTERGQVICTLTPETVNKLKGILTGKFDERGNHFNERTIANRTNHMHFFKIHIYTKYYDNNSILRIKDESRKHRPIKVVGWYVTSNLLSIINNPKNWI